MSSLINNSTIPNLLNYVSTARLSAFCFNKEATIKIINALNINQTDDHENISIWMIKLCRSLLLYLPVYNFKNCPDTGISPGIWKRSNIVKANLT